MLNVNYLLRENKLGENNLKFLFKLVYDINEILRIYFS